MSKTFYINCETRGNNLLLTYGHGDQVNYVKVPSFKPVMYTEAHGQETIFRDLVSGVPLLPKQYDSIREANQAIREARDVDGISMYGTRQFNYAFLHKQFKDMESSYNPDMIRGFILDIECPSEVGFPDPGKAEWPIDVMGIYDTFTKKYHIWGLKQFNVDKYADKLREEGVDPADIIYNHIEEEVIMLDHMLRWWNRNTPAYLTGWNTSTFDNPYLCHRLQRLGLDMNQLSPWGVTTIREGEFMGKPEFKVNMLGIADLDYLELYKKNRFKVQESYKLDHIAHVELGKKKVDYSEVAANLRTLNKKDWDLYTTYNVMDVALVKQLDDKLGYLAITFAVAYAAGINYSDVKSPVATWENIFFRDQIDKGVVLPPKKHHEKVSYEGGYVKFPHQGKHRWVCSFDLNSLYPHLIMGSNISPETITPIIVSDATVDNILEGVATCKRTFDMPDGNISVCASGYTFSNDKLGIAGEQMNKLYVERKQIKKEMLAHEQDVETIKGGNATQELFDKYGLTFTEDITQHHELCAAAAKQATLKDGGQMVRKILLNSFYGALANIHFALFDIRLAESITKQGQLAIRWAGDWVNKELNVMLKTDTDYVVYTDTDSIYVKLDEVVTRMKMQDRPTAEIVTMLDKFCDAKMQPMIEAGYDELQKQCNSFSQKMIMAREVISDNSVFCSKKRYTMSVWNSEGVAFEEAYIKTMGMDVVKSSTPQVVRGAMKKTITMILNSNEADVQQFIKGFKRAFKDEKPEDIAFPRGVNGCEEKYCNGAGIYLTGVTVPINSRAAITYNQGLKSNNLDNYREIIPGDKIKYIHVKLPNKLHTNVIGFSDILPPEFNLHDKIDYDLMFFKTYLKPMNDIIELIGWTSEPVATLDSFFD
jgi:DNA polymerase elongation subunit (family B)